MCFWMQTNKSYTIFELPHDKTNNVAVHPVWSESSLCAQWVAKDPSFLHADSEDSDQTGRMTRLIWVFARRLISALASIQSDQSSLCAQWVAKDPSFLHADSEDSDQTGRMTRLIWVFARRLISAWASIQSDQSSLCAQWVAKDPSFLHADSEDSDQTGRMPRLICVLLGAQPHCWFCHETAHFTNMSTRSHDNFKRLC